MDGVTPPTSTFSPLSTGLPEWPPQQHDHLENLSPPLDWAEQSLPVFLSQSSSHGLGHGLRRCTTVTVNPQYSIQGEAGSLGSMGSDLLWRREERVTCRQCLNHGVDHNPSRHESTHSPDSSSPRHPRSKTKKKKKKKKRRNQSPTSISYSSGEFRHASVNCDLQLPAEDDPDQQLWHECVLASRPSTSGGTKGKDQTGRVFGCCCGATSDDSDDETTFLVQSREYGIPYPWEVNTTRRRLATALKTVLCCCCCCGGGQQ